jgi:4-hydroxy-tetrahydrodipicolinate synthase
MSQPKKFHGVGVAITTPFLKNDEIDFQSLGKQVEHVIKGGVDYIVLFGTTGESSTISHEEKQIAAVKVLEMIGGRVPLVVGFGGNNTRELISHISNFDFRGIDAILSVCPYYNKPNQEGIYQHFKAVCNHSPLPVIIYNVPGRTVVNIEPDTTIRIAKDCPNVIAIKEATDNLDQVMDLISRKPDNLLVIAGDDALALPFMALGAHGAISVISNAFPSEFCGIVHSAADGNFDLARTFHYKLLPLMHTLLKTGNPPGIKAVLHCLGLCENHFRLPVHRISDALYDSICQITQQLKTKQ